MKLKKAKEENPEREVTEKKTKKEKKPKKEKMPKKPKSEAYVMRKNTGLKILRVLLWGMIVFIFIRGVLSCLQRDKEAVVDQMIRQFKTDYGTFSTQNEEVMAFAQNFVREYLTYEVKGEEDYRKRLADYVYAGFFNNSVIDSFNARAEAVYVQAYRVEDYSADQKDVYVQAEVEYTNRIPADGTTYTEESSRQSVTLKVPVYCKDSRYVVESVPLVVNDSMQIEEYKITDFYGTYVSEQEAAAIKTSVNNFLKAYCEQDESVINYYLAASADKEDFTGLNGRYTYEGISGISSYQGTTDIICIVEYKVKDSGNGIILTQKINLAVTESGGKYYIKTMDTRTGNLNRSGS